MDLALVLVGRSLGGSLSRRDPRSGLGARSARRGEGRWIQSELNYSRICRERIRKFQVRVCTVLYGSAVRRPAGTRTAHAARRIAHRGILILSGARNLCPNQYPNHARKNKRNNKAEKTEAVSRENCIYFRSSKMLFSLSLTITSCILYTLHTRGYYTIIYGVVPYIALSRVALVPDGGARRRKSLGWSVEPRSLDPRSSIHAQIDPRSSIHARRAPRLCVSGPPRLDAFPAPSMLSSGALMLSAGRRALAAAIGARPRPWRPAATAPSPSTCAGSTRRSRPTRRRRRGRGRACR